MTDDARIIWHGRSWRLRVEPYALPDGSVIERGFVEHPGSVVLIPINNTPTGPVVLMLHQYRAALQKTILELPAGTREWDEDWLACAQRELQEETGYRADSFTPLGEVWPAPGVSNECMKLYLATGLHADPLPADVDEEIVVQPMPLSELLQMAQDGRMHDAKSIVGLWRAAAVIQNP